jgi:two-component system nitrate/nitrite response regulator NarL
MDIILCCASDQVKTRWTNILSTNFELGNSSSLAGLSKMIEPDDGRIVLLNRELVSEEKLDQFRQITSRLGVFLLSDRPDDEEGLLFLKCGIVGYANTYTSPARLTEAVRLIFGGSVWVGQNLMQRLILETRKKSGNDNVSSDNNLLAELTKREREISELVSQGKTNLEVAYALEITERTVKSHLSSIFTKLSVTSRLNLALLLNRSK